MELAEIRKRAMYDPQSLSKSEWEQIHKAAFTVPKKDFFDDDDTPKVSSSSGSPKQKRKNWW
jgi:hypothetical protein